MLCSYTVVQHTSINKITRTPCCFQPVFCKSKAAAQQVKYGNGILRNKIHVKSSQKIMRKQFVPQMFLLIFGEREFIAKAPSVANSSV